MSDDRQQRALELLDKLTCTLSEADAFTHCDYRRMAKAIVPLIAQAEADAEARIVAWLKSRRMSFRHPTRNAQAALDIAANKIERGDHRKEADHA